MLCWMERRPSLRMAPALSLTRNWPHSAGISQRKKKIEMKTPPPPQKKNQPKLEQEV